MANWTGEVTFSKNKIRFHKKIWKRDAKSLTVSPAEIKQQKGPWPFLRSRAFSGPAPRPTNFFRTFECLVLDKIFTELGVLFHFFFFFKLESISGEVFRCFHLGRNTVIQCQEENRVSFWSGAHQGQFGEHWRAGVLWHQEPRGWFETKWPQECRWQHFLFLFCVLSSLFPFLPFKMAEKAGAIS